MRVSSWQSYLPSVLSGHTRIPFWVEPDMAPLLFLQRAILPSLPCALFPGHTKAHRDPLVFLGYDQSSPSRVNQQDSRPGRCCFVLMGAVPLPHLPSQKHESVKTCSCHSGLCFLCTDAFHWWYFCFPQKHCRTQCLFSTTVQVLISLALPQGWNWSPVSYGITWEGTGGPRLGWKGVLGYGEDERRLWAAPTIQDFQPKPFISFVISMEIFFSCYYGDYDAFFDCIFLQGV